MPNIHPVLTHFPIALLSVSLAFDLASLLFKKDELQRVAWWSQLLGTIGLAATVITGLFAKELVSIPASARDTLQSHEQIAFVVVALTTVLLLWRISSRTQLPERMRAVFVMLLVATVLLMWVGAWYGGELIYSFGVGVSPQN